MTSSMQSSPSSSLQSRRGRRLAVGLPLGGGQAPDNSTSCTSVDLPDRKRRDRHQHAQGTSTSIFLRLCARAPEILICRVPGLRRAVRELNAQLAGQVASGQRSWCVLQYFVVSSLGDQLAAVLSGARTEIENAVGGAHHVGIVLHHQDRVSQVAQVVQDLDQPVGVAAVQSDGRLVQHVERSHQTRAQRRRQLNALRFAAGKRRSQPVQRQIFQAHIVQELQALANLLAASCRRSRLPARSVRARRRNFEASSTVMLVTWQMFLPFDLHLLRFDAQPRAAAAEQVEYPR